MLTVKTIENRVEQVRALAHDPERAHSEEDRLHVDVLHAIATRQCRNSAACARAVLKTRDISFARWCA